MNRLSPWSALSAPERVLTVLRTAQRFQDPADSWARLARQQVPASTGLSLAGYETALRCMEVHGSAGELGALQKAVVATPRVHVVLAATVFTAVVRALALAVACSPTVLLKPSRRDPAFAQLLVQALQNTCDHSEVHVVSALEATPGDQVHAYGSDATLTSLAHVLPANVPLWAHGTGVGVAVIEEASDLHEAAEQLAQSVILYDQRGCLSPRVVLFVGSSPGAQRFARALAEALRIWKHQVPVGVFDENEKRSQRLYGDSLQLAGYLYGDLACLVGVDPAPRALFWPAGPRVVHVARVDNHEQAWALLQPLAPNVVALGGSGDVMNALAAHVPHARTSPLEHMQRPALDGPVDRRVPHPLLFSPRRVSVVLGTRAWIRSIVLPPTDKSPRFHCAREFTSEVTCDSMP